MADGIEEVRRFVAAGAASFLQSEEWQAVQQRMGRRTERIASVLVIRHDLPFGFHYLYCPRPAAPGQEFFRDATAVTRVLGALFLKIDPSQTITSMIHDSRFVIQESHSLQPIATLLIDCQKSDEQLLLAMHPKTRYNIRLAERHGVSVRRVQRPVPVEDFETFLRLLRRSAERDAFVLHPAEHYRILLDVATEQFSPDLFIAERRGSPLAAAIVNCYQPSKTATYLHGGSSYESRALMAPYLLHWRIIQAGRERGIVTYDFGGVDSVRWPGLTRFKQGFGGRAHTFPPSVDIIFRPELYHFYRLQRFMRGRD